jgi:hypothetical protein
MNCINCTSPIQYKGGENKKDFGCRNQSCPSKIEANYSGFVYVRDNWWFLEKYGLPFKFDNCWWLLTGEANHKTILYKIIKEEQSNINGYVLMYNNNIRQWVPYYKNDEYEHKKVLTTRYHALPANSDFNHEFTKLIEKIMGLVAIK